MQTFKYSGISPDGAKVSGVVEAFSQYDALTKINATCPVVTKITPVSKDDIKAKLFGNKKIKEKSLAMMCTQLSIILKSGMPIVRAIELVSDQVEDKQLKNIMGEVADDVSQGVELARSFETKEGVFPVTFVETVRSGEKSGTLEKSFEKLAVFFEKSSKLKNKVISSLIYPAFTIGVAVVVIAIIMVVAVPQFTKSFSSLGIELPVATRMIIALSNFMSTYIILILLFIAAAVVALKMYHKTEKGRLGFSKRRVKMPIFGKLTVMKASSQFANTMSTLLSAGLPVIQAVTATGRMMDNYYIGTEMIKTVTVLEEGGRMSQALRKCTYLPKLLVEMIGVGEETGTLETTLDVIGLYYDSETEVAANRALSLLEPIIITFLALFIVLILLAVYMPMFSLYGAMGA